MVKSRPGTIDAYLAAQSPPVRAALRTVRATIAKAVPEAEEAISYGMPAYRLRGRVLVYFAGWKEHWALYPGAAAVVGLPADALRPYQRSKGTIRFPLDRPVPRALVTLIARLRARMVEEKVPAKATARARRRPSARATRTRRG